MNKSVSPPVVIAVIVVLVLVIIGAFVLSSKGSEGKRPDAAAGGTRTPGGKVLPTASGAGNG